MEARSSRNPSGGLLSDMANDLEDGGYIVEFVSGGPKNYGYITSTGKVCCKVRGFTLNVLNYAVIRDNVLTEIYKIHRRSATTPMSQTLTSSRGIPSSSVSALDPAPSRMP